MLSGHQTGWPNDKMLVHLTCWIVQHLSFGRAFNPMVFRSVEDVMAVHVLNSTVFICGGYDGLTVFDEYGVLIWLPFNGRKFYK